MSDHQATSTRGAPGLFGDALSHVSNLVREEVSLARAEVSENVSRAGIAIGFVVAGLVLAVTALNVLAAALVDAVANMGLDVGWAALVVGVVLALLAVALAIKGRNDLRLASLAPTRAARNVRRDAVAVKEAYENE